MHSKRLCKCPYSGRILQSHLLLLRIRWTMATVGQKSDLDQFDPTDKLISRYKNKRFWGIQPKLLSYFLTKLNIKLIVLKSDNTPTNTPPKHCQFHLWPTNPLCSWHFTNWLSSANITQPTYNQCHKILSKFYVIDSYFSVCHIILALKISPSMDRGARGGGGGDTRPPPILLEL